MSVSWVASDSTQIDTAPPFLLIANEAVLARALQLLGRAKDVLGAYHGTQTVGVVAVEMGEQHVINVGRGETPRRELLVNSLALSDASLAHMIQNPRREAFDLHPLGLSPQRYVFFGSQASHRRA